MNLLKRDIFTSLLKESEIKYLLSRCENGTEDIISVRSKAFQALQKDIDDYSMKELVTLISGKSIDSKKTDSFIRKELCGWI